MLTVKSNSSQLSAAKEKIIASLSLLILTVAASITLAVLYLKRDQWKITDAILIGIFAGILAIGLVAIVLVGKSIAELIQRNQGLSDQVDKQKKEIDGLTKNAQGLSKGIAEASNGITGGNKRATMVRGDIDLSTQALKESVESIRKRVDSLQEKNNLLEEQLRDEKEQVQQQAVTIKNKDGEISGLKEQLSEKNNKITELVGKHKNLECEVNNLKKQLTGKENAELVGKHKNLECEVNNLKKQLTGKENEISKLQGELAEASQRSRSPSPTKKKVGKSQQNLDEIKKMTESLGKLQTAISEVLTNASEADKKNDVMVRMQEISNVLSTISGQLNGVQNTILQKKSPVREALIAEPAQEMKYKHPESPTTTGDGNDQKTQKLGDLGENSQAAPSGSQSPTIKVKKENGSVDSTQSGNAIPQPEGKEWRKKIGDLRKQATIALKEVNFQEKWSNVKGAVNQVLANASGDSPNGPMTASSADNVGKKGAEKRR